MRIATRAGRRLALRPKELAVLECLLAAQGKPVSAEELLERVWDTATDPFTTTVKSTINRLRAKLGPPDHRDRPRERLPHRRTMMHMRRNRPGRLRWLRWPRRTARLRLTALYGCLFLVLGAALVATTYGLFERATAYRRPRLPNIPRSPAIRDVKLPSSLAQALPQLGRVQALLTRTEYQLSQGSPLAQSRSSVPFPARLLSRDQRELARDQRQLADTGSVEAALRAADSHQLLVDSGIALAAAAVVALVAGWLVAGKVLRPIRTITRRARRISSASLHERLCLGGPEDELKELGDTLDDLFGRLDAAFEAQRHFVANASHELRTPLTADRNLLQVALDDPNTSASTWRSTAEELLASNDEQGHLIEALLTLATSERGIDHREPLELSDVVQTVLADRCHTGGLGLDIEVSLAPAPVEGDPRLVESLVANLVDNAIVHNVEGGRVDVSTRTDGGAAVLAVTNTGPIVPSTEVDRLFQPFQRLERHRIHHRSGHGLGLSIVRAIAAAHGATVTVVFAPKAEAPWCPRDSSPVLALTE